MTAHSAPTDSTNAAGPDHRAADAPAAPPAGVSRFIAQRMALDQVMGLSSECARDYGRLEQVHCDAINGAAEEFRQSREALSASHTTRRDAIQQEADEAVAEHRRVFAEAKTSSDSEAASKRVQLSQKQQLMAKRLGKEHADGTWLVDTVLEGETARIEEAVSAVVQAVTDDSKRLDELHASATILVSRYGQALPPAAPEAPGAGERITDAGSLPAVLETRRGAVEAELAAMQKLMTPRLFLGPVPWFMAGLVLLVVAGAGHVLSTGAPLTLERITQTSPDWKVIGVALAVAAMLVGAAWWWLRGIAVRRLREAGRRFVEALHHGQALASLDRKALKSRFDEQLLDAKLKHATDTHTANARHERHARSTKSQYESLLAEINDTAQTAEAEAVRIRDAAVLETQAQRDRELAELEAWSSQQIGEIQLKRDQMVGIADTLNKAGQAELVRRWERALEITRGLSDESDRPEFAAIDDWRAWRPPQKFAPTVRFGELAVDMRRFIGEARETDDGQAVIGGSNGEGLRLPIPEPYAVPALLAFPDFANLLIKYEPDGRDAAVATLRLTMLRLLTSLPPGRVHFTLIDPVGLGRSFAGFMHLADFEEELVGGRVWTESEAIEKRLTDLTEHMETVIQKYLRNEFETIDAYNAQAGELAEPYRFVVIADLPTAFSERAFTRLASIAASGKRCGVHVLAALDTRHTVRGSEAMLEDLGRHCNTLLYEPGEDGKKHFRWQDTTFGRLPLTLDTPPDDSGLTDVLRVLGQAARDAKRVEVPISSIIPRENEMWSRNSALDLHVAVGRMGATRLQTFRLGRGVAQHALIAGKTGSGKSTLLNVLITNLSLWYPPDQLELYLVDFKRGVEFMAYATGRLPHARAVAVESDREFGLSVLQRLDEELARRGDVFRAAGVQDLASYRKSGQPLPRVLLIVDEFQELFSEDDSLTQDASLLIDRLVRQGRAFGIHVILGSQTIGGQTGLGRATLGQMAVRVALQCTEADSQLILGDNNTAARLLGRPGEAIYNDAGGVVENNSPFQVAWLDDGQRDALLQRARERAQRDGVQAKPAIVFEGNAPANLGDNEELRASLAGEPVRRSAIYLGDPVAIKEPTHVLLRRQAGSNILVVGQHEENVLGVIASTLISLTATGVKTEKGRRLWPRFVVLDGTPHDAPRAGYVADVARRLPATVDVVDYRAVPEAFADLSDELRARLDAGAPDAQPIVLIIHGIQRYRNLTRSDDLTFGGDTSAARGGGGFADIIGGDDGAETGRAAATIQPDQVLVELLREGPLVGMHVLLTADTLTNLERRLSRESLREFDARVLFQMSGNDSSVLLDSLAASRLGFYRALVASEELGTVEKFRPYAPPDEALLAELTEHLQ